MAEYIDKQALITEIQSAVSMVLQTAPYEKVWFDRFVDRQNEIVAIIERQPAADVAPVRRGRWIISQEYNDIIDMDVAKYTCPVCGQYRLSATTLSQATDFCPNCGARMDGGADNG